MHTLKPAKGARRKSRRVGRGNASSKGTTAGRGTKGQLARAGGRNRRALRGMRRILLSTPKLRGFKSLKKKPATVNVAVLDKAYRSGETVNPDTLAKKRVVTSVSAGVKILGSGDIKKKLAVTGCAVSGGAKKKIEDAGGSVS